MKKEKLFKGFDLILVFWSVLFLISPFFSPNVGIEIVLIFIVSGISLFAYLIYVITLRRDRNIMIDRENQALVQMESEKTEDVNTFFEVKQGVLENMVESELQSLFPSAKIFKNIYCPKPDGSTSEIDILMISLDGLFLFEAKNYSARLTGNWSEEKLIAKYASGKEIEVLNPVIQNSYHFQYLKNLLGINSQYAIKNIVVLGDAVIYNREELKTVPGYAGVCKFKGIEREIYLRSRSSKGIFKESQVCSIAKTITERMSSTADRKAKHDQNIINNRKPEKENK